MVTKMHLLLLFLIINCKTLFNLVNIVTNVDYHISNNFCKFNK
jgi:hypothetical protein